MTLHFLTRNSPEAGLWHTCALAAVVSLVCAKPVLASDSASALALKALLGPQAAFQQQGGLPPTPAYSAAPVPALLPVGGAAGAASSGGASMAPSAAAATSGVTSTVTVQRGETLDRLIRRAMPDVPLHPDFLRKAFVSLNPQVFPPGSTNLMRTGATLQVPSMAALRQMMISQHPASAALLQAVVVQTEQHAPKDPSHWVRYP